MVLIASSPYPCSSTLRPCKLSIAKPSLAADNLLRLYSFVSRAAFGIEKPEQFLKGFRVSRIPEVSAFAPDAHQVLILQFFEMMRQGAGGYSQFVPHLTDHHPFGMSAQ